MTVTKIAPSGITPPIIPASPPLPKTANFQSIMERIGKEFSPMIKDISQLSKQIGVPQVHLDAKNPLNPQLLINAQIKVSELQLKTELLSKAVDSALQVTKKLQSPQ